MVIDGAICEDAARAEELLAPLRALAPEMDTFADMAPVGLSYIHMDPEEPMPGMSDSAILDGLVPRGRRRDRRRRRARARARRS